MSSNEIGLQFDGDALPDEPLGIGTTEQTTSMTLERKVV